MQTMTTFRNPLADPLRTVMDPLWSADPSLKTAALLHRPNGELCADQKLAEHKIQSWNFQSAFNIPSSVNV